MTTVRDVMTADPSTVSADATLDQIATIMREDDTGFVPVIDGDQLLGTVTDRDIVIRAVAEGKAPQDRRAEDVLTEGLATVSAGDDAQEAARTMREADVRRVPVLEDDRLVGVVAIGDLAIEIDEDSALADISAASPDE